MLSEYISNFSLTADYKSLFRIFQTVSLSAIYTKTLYLVNYHEFRIFPNVFILTIQTKDIQAICRDNQKPHFVNLISNHGNIVLNKAYVYLTVNLIQNHHPAIRCTKLI